MKRTFKIKDGKVIVKQTFKKPKSCCKCHMFGQGSYSCHNESGYQAYCELGFFDGEDMRDKGCKYTYSYCKL